MPRSAISSSSRATTDRSRPNKEGQINIIGTHLIRASIALASLLLCASALAQGWEGKWYTSERSGCRFWDPAPRENERIEWSGRCLNGLAEGNGVLQWYLGDSPSGRYVGEARAGKLEGRGVLRYPDSGRYEGDFAESEPNGRGVYVRADGARYEGELRRGKFHGRGTLTSLDGEAYSGDWREGEMDGQGIMTFPSGERYEGEVRGSKINGYGTWYRQDGSRSSGIWSNGRLLRPD